VDHHVARKERVGRDERDVVVGVTRRVDDVAGFRADPDLVAVGEFVGASRVVGVGVQVGVERVEDGS